MNENLYSLIEGKEELDKLVEIENEEELKQYQLAIQNQIIVKTENIIKFLKNRESFCLSIDEEIKRLKELKSKFQKGNERLKNFVKFVMENKEIKKLESPLGSFSFRKSKSVEVTDENLIDDKFCEFKKVPNKTKIKKAIEEGKEVKGAKILEKNNLIIK